MMKTSLAMYYQPQFDGPFPCLIRPYNWHISQPCRVTRRQHVPLHLTLLLDTLPGKIDHPSVLLVDFVH